ncbi:non-ribosomal peptide synthetase [Streptomyces sp. HNM0663]|uniref:Non-ribosomal peptide synthetase n=1 Tax=Streptomyces chengmaiensis TaxID=3040919 RepID=A0ABT6HJ62_9ACTN|nr:non-ribosomal peptide synthetase [Streptomyces chengmaiensis]MDH2387919.1 non-ribosomal peptide synthetase [Streptomyces chengmaiensis]
MTVQQSAQARAVERGEAFFRPVSAAEWSYLAAAHLGELLVLQLAVEGTGPLDAADLSRAVAGASASCPGSRLVRRGRMWIDGGRPARVVVADVRGAAGGRRTAAGGAPELTELPEAAAPLAAAEGDPSCEVLLLTGGTTTTVVFRASHAAMDLKGLSHWAAEVFRVLRGEPPAGAAGTLTDDALLDAVGRSGRRPRFGLNRLSPLGGRPGDVTLWRRRTVAGRHAALVAKTAAAIADAVPGPPARIMVPADLRRHAPGVASTANLALPLFLDVPAGQGGDAVHRRLLDALAARRELVSGAEAAAARLPLPAAAALVGAVRAATRARHRYPASAIVSNAGRVAPEAFSAGGFTATTVYALPVHAPLVPVSVALVELPDHTEVVVSARGAADVGERCDALLDRVVSALRPQRAVVPLAGRSPAAQAAQRLLAPGPGGLPSLQATVVRLFREQAARRPDLPAVLGDGPAWSYQELDRRSDSVAAGLLARGVRRGEVVGVLADRSALGLAAVWGVLKAGAAFLPVDVRNPARRVAELLGDAQARLCLVDGVTRAGAVPDGVTAVLLEDAVREDPVVGEESRAVLAAAAPGPDDLAYVIYTSGSTGRPKGVQIEHRSLANLAGWIAPFMRCDEETRAAYSFSPGFDLSVMQIFPPLLHGGAVVPVPGELDHVKLRELLSGRSANTLGLTPTHLDLAARLGIRPGGIRALQSGGENLTAATARRTRAAFGPDCLFVNVYGPTEATVACTVAVVADDICDGRPSAPIGTPVHRTSAAVLDERGNDVPDGEPGELHITGVQLARGYLGRPELTADRFVFLPDGRRAYRTGDLAVRRPDGLLEYRGRIDSQVKIRGHRVEPGEVEAALAALPGIAQAAVVARPRPDTGALALCAFVVPAPGTGRVDGTAVRTELELSLPPHLVPSAVREIPALPETAGGKTDRNALPDPFADVLPVGGAGPMPSDGVGPMPSGGAPEPDVAAVTARIWARVLRCPVADLDAASDFHALGGDSLAVLEMLAGLGEELLGRTAEREFLDRLGPLSRDLTLGRVVDAVTALRSTS